MKTMKKTASLLLALVLLFALAMPAFAVTNKKQGKITISNATVGETYTIYQIFELESFVEGTGSDSGVYAYTIKQDSPWYGFVSEGGAGAAYVNLLEEDADAGLDYDGIYVTWKGTDENKVADAAAFAAAAIAYAKANSNKVSGTAKTADSTPVVFDNLSLGYYLVDTTLGTVCSLDTTATEVEIQEKNTAPTIDKTVQEDSQKGENGTEGYGAANSAQVGDTVNFKVVVKAYKGAENYVVHDTMSTGLTFKASSVAITDSNNKTLTANTDYTVVTTDLGTCANTPVGNSGCTFHIAFTDAYLNSITADTDITITYNATLNGDAAMYTTPVTPTDINNNPNDTLLTYADDNATAVSHTNTYTYSFDLVKTDAANVLLTGAEFELYDATTNGKKIAVVKETGENASGNYRIATTEEAGAEGFTSASIAVTNGKVVVEGLDANTTYYLQETKAPDGYNKLKTRVAVEMKEANLTAQINQGEQNPATWTSGGVRVINNTGAQLPSTGGMGTTMFYVLGGALVLCALVLLVARKRVHSAK